MSTSVVRKVLTKTKFKAWLESKDPNDFVGETSDGDSCPITNYFYYAVPDADGVNTSNKSIEYYLPTNEFAYNSNIPNWATRFITEIDNFGKLHGTEVEANKALEILHKI